MLKEKNVQIYLSVLIFIISLLMGVGFSAAGNITLNISGTGVSEGEVQEPYISSATLSNYVGTSQSGNNITYDSNTFANIDVSLSNINPYSNVTYTITISNPTEDDYYFDDVLYELGDNTYSNENIVFDLDGILQGDLLPSKSSITFDITFHYKDNDLQDSNILDALLNFRMYIPNLLSRDWAVKAGFKSSYDSITDVNNVQTITFYSNGSTFSGIPIDVSNAQDGSILLYKIFDNATNKYDLKITSNDIISFPRDSSWLFAKYSYLNNLNFNESVDTSQVINMSQMFNMVGKNVSAFSMDLSSFNTSNVTDMSLMFYSVGYGAQTLSIGDINNWDVSKVNNMQQMFDGFGYNASTVKLDLNGWNSKNVTNMSDMFLETGYNASTIELKLTNWNTNRVTNMSQMFLFAGYNSLEFELDLSSWNTSSVTDMSNMFSFCRKLSKIYIGDSWNTENVINSTNMFLNTPLLPNYDSSYVDKSKAISECSGGYLTIKGQICGNVLSKDWAIISGYKTDYDTIKSRADNAVLNSIEFYNNGSTFSGTPKDVSKAQNGSILLYEVKDYSVSPVQVNIKISSNSTIYFPEDSSHLFSIFSNVINFNNSVNTSNVTDMSYMFYKCSEHSAGFSTDISSWDVSKVEDMSYMFHSSGYMSTSWHIGDLSNWNTRNLKNISYMFFHTGDSDPNYNIGDLSNWDVSNVTNMEYAFVFIGGDNANFSIGDLGNWDVSNVTNMKGLFVGAAAYSKTWPFGDLSTWDTSNVTNMSYMFESVMFQNNSTWKIDCISTWDTSNVTDMSYMFQNIGASASSASLDVSNWNVSKVTTMEHMFYGSGDNLQNYTIDLSGWNTLSLTNIDGMFSYSEHLAKVYVGSGWDISKVTASNYVFSNATALVGGNGTAYNSLYVDYKRAVIDGVSEFNGGHGYFSAKTGPYSINATSNDINYGTVTGFGSYVFNATVTLSATPKTNYGFVGWYNNNTLISTESIYTFKAFNNRDIVGLFKPERTLTLDINNSSYGSVNGGGIHIMNDSVTISATPNSGYKFTGWFDNNNNLISLQENYSFIMPDSNVTYMAKFEECLSPSWSIQKVPGSTYEFIQNENGYYESNNKGVANSFALSMITVTLPNNNTSIDLYCINYAQASYDYGIIGLLNEPLALDNMEDLNIAKTFKNDNKNTEQVYSFTGLSAGTYNIYIKFIKNASGNSYNDSLQFKIGFDGNTPIDRNVIQKTLLLTSDNPTYGSVSGGGTYHPGEDITITATTNSGYKFTGWYDWNNNLLSYDDSYTFSMPNKNQSYVAKFVEYVSPTWSIERAPDASYRFVQNGDGYYESTNQGIANSAAVSIITINAPNDNTTIDFHCINYAQAAYDYGIIGMLDDVLTIDSTADENISKSFKGLSQSTEQVYSFKNVSAGTHTIYIKYIKNNSTNSYNDSLQFKVGFDGNEPIDRTILYKNVTLTVDKPNAGSTTGGGAYEFDDIVTITSTANSGYKFSGWYDGNNLISSRKNYTFTMPNNNLAYTAKFDVYTGPTWTLQKAPGASYEFIQNDNGYYESTSQGIANSAAVSVVTINVPNNNTTIDFYCINYAQANYDYGIIGILDDTLTVTNTADTNISKSFKGLSQSNEQIFSFTNVSSGTHTIYIKYIKNGSTNSYNDSLQFKIGFNGETPIDAN